MYACGTYLTLSKFVTLLVITSFSKKRNMYVMLSAFSCAQPGLYIFTENISLIKKKNSFTVFGPNMTYKLQVIKDLKLGLGLCKVRQIGFHLQLHPNLISANLSFG